MSKLLVVEGVEDELLFKQILRNIGLNSVDVKSHPSGKGNAISTFCSAVMLYDRVGLVVDADFPTYGGGFSDTQKLINSDLNKINFGPLGALPGGGLGCLKTRKRQGVWIMPDNISDGYLENFLDSMIEPSLLGGYQYADQATRTALSASVGFTAKTHHRCKSNFGAWLAWHDPPRMSFAKAMSNCYFDKNSNSYKSITNWLKWIFL